MGDLTKNISRHELECPCGECSVRILDDEPVIQIVQECADDFAERLGVEKLIVIVTSAARCFTYNRSKKIGSNDNSQHPRCCAIDFQLFMPKTKDQIEPELINQYLIEKYPNSLGIGLYQSFNHVDTRPNKARWKI